MINFHRNNLIYYVLVLLPFTYLIGIFITELFVLTIISYFFIKNRDLNFFRDKKFIFLCLISIYFGINAFIQINDDLKISSIFHFRYIIFSLSIFFCLKYFENIQYDIRSKILFVIFTLVALIIFDALFQFFTGENFLGYKIIKNRISGIFETESHGYQIHEAYI